ncbi:ABC transporter ATP-binding protein [Armatimonadota bacterium]|nr:ABC transporter ATP-binding protein [Armatimonadota bacterium]
MSAISVRNLNYELPEKRILHDISFDLESGEIVSIMGPSGSGKTTLLKLLTGLLRPTSGQIIVEGTDIAKLSETELDVVRLKMGLVFQYAALFDSLTVYDNILFSVVRHRKRVPREELETIVRERLDAVGLGEVEWLLPSQLSGGMQKRVGLARALAMNPSFIFYDEPTSGLDPITAHTIDELIVETGRNRNVTSVVVSHHLPSVFRISDRVAMMYEGELVALSTPKELLASENKIVQAFLAPERESRQQRF